MATPPYHTTGQREVPVRASRPREQKTEPSEASGGIPNPTEEYVQRSLILPQLLPEPQNLLVVIDLNGTLLFRPSRARPTHFTLRPNAARFVQYCLDTFQVVIWSSAREPNVAAMVKAIIPPARLREVVAIWGRGSFNLTKADYAARTICYKRLTKLWDNPEVGESHPNYQMGGRWNQTNTVLIDDSLEKAKAEPHNIIEVPDWTGDLTDNVLPAVHDYLNELSRHSNVSGYLRTAPFKGHLARMPGRRPT